MTNIQPSALLLRVGADWRVEMASANVGLIGDVRPSAVIGEPLADLIGGEALHALRNRLSWLAGDDSVVYDYGVQWGEVALDVHATSDGDGFLIEGELSAEPRLPDAIGMVRSMSERLSGNDPAVLAVKAMRLLKTLTGYHRVSLVGASGREAGSSDAKGTAATALIDGVVGIKFPVAVVDREAEGVPLIGDVGERPQSKLTFLAPTDAMRARMEAAGAMSAMSIPLRVDGLHVATLHADNPTPVQCGAERRSLANLFAERLVARMMRSGWNA